MALTKLTSNLIEGGTGTDWVTAIQTSNFTAAAGKGYFVNTTSQVLYVNLPVGVVGMEITIQDYAGTFATNKVILNANGSEKIQGSALEGKINTNNATAVLIYQDATKGWTSQDVELNATIISWATPTGQSLTYSTPSPQSSAGTAAAAFPSTTFTATKAGEVISGTATIAGLPSGITAAQTITGSGAGNTLTVTLTGTFPSTNSLNTALTLSGLTVAVPPILVTSLIVAGGGGGGIHSGAGGGAGGLLYYGSETPKTPNGPAITLSVSTNYALTIGGGGASSGGPYNTVGGNGGNGQNSIFSTFIASGGGGGGGNDNSTNGPGRAGGSGGGGMRNYPFGTGTTGQGNDGSNWTTSASQYPGGGGGGAGAAGGTVTSTQAGNGGIGLQYSITGTATYYAGGGGGNLQQGAAGVPPQGSGGLGGGGEGRLSGTGASGTPNTGGGGGGNQYDSTGGGSGGSGIVILRYTGVAMTNPGSGLTFTTATVGSDKVTTFTAGTGNIQFN